MDSQALLDAVTASATEILLICAACAVLMIEVFRQHRPARLSGNLALLTLLLAAAVNLAIPAELPVYNQMYVQDPLARLFKGLFCLVGIAIVLVSPGYLYRKQLMKGEYFAFLLFTLSGMMLMVSGLDLLTVYVGIELVALSTYILCGFARRDLHSTEAALKYVILGALSSAILLYGISLCYGLTGTTQLQQVAIGLSQAGNAGAIRWLAISCLVAGLGFKVAAVPFHMWLPDVYQGAPTPVTAFMAVGPKVAGFVVLMRLLYQGLPQQAVIWSDLLTILAIATLATGSLVALVQQDIKRLLAYSGIAHAGFVLMGLTTASADGYSAAVFYLVAYAFMSLGVFTVVVLLYRRHQTREAISDYAGLSRQRPWLAAAMTLFLFSLAGIPPTSGFIAKLGIIMALLEQQLWGLALFAVLFSVVAAYYYLRLIMLIWMKPAGHDFPVRLPYAGIAVVALSAALTLLLGILPGPLLERLPALPL